MEIKTDVVIVGTGVGGAFSALNLPEDKKILMITKSDLESSDSFLAQGGICVLRDESDYDSYFEEGVLSGASRISIYDESINDNTAIIDGVEYINNSETLIDYLGEDISFIYRENEREDTREILWFQSRNKNNAARGFRGRTSGGRNLYHTYGR